MVFVLLPLHFSSLALSSFLSSFSFWSVIFEQPKTCQVFPLSQARLSLCTKLNCRLSAHLICILLIKESYIVLSLVFSKPSEVAGYSAIIPIIKCGFEKLLERYPPLSVKKTEWQKRGGGTNKNVVTVHVWFVLYKQRTEHDKCATAFLNSFHAWLLLS